MLKNLLKTQNLFLILSVMVFGTVILHLMGVGFPQDQGDYFPLVQDVEWSSPGEILENFSLSFQDYSQGFARTAKGYLIFILMSIFFISTGSLLIRAVLGNENINPSISSTLNSIEKLALSYLLGTLFSSLLWLLLGLAGVLSSGVAWIVLGMGMILFLIQNQLSYGTEIIQQIRVSLKKLNRLEMSLGIFILFLLLSFSTFSIHFQSHIDPLFSEIGLPSFYLQYGEISSYPYHIYSYTYQNIQMLMLWCLLLGSEVAAAMTIWGFLVATVLLCFGFFMRHTNRITALLTILMLLSAPLLIQQSIKIKNDVPAAAFILALFIILNEGFKRCKDSPNNAGRWFLFAGILCGGAVGQKQFNLVVFGISTITVLVIDLIHKNTSRKRGSWVLLWLTGFFLATSIWFVKTTVATGNPFYPLFNDFLGIEPVKHWHGKNEFTKFYGLIRNGWPGMQQYFSHITYFGKDVLWGPSILFIFGSFLFITKKFSYSLKVVSLIALLSWLILLPYAYEPRFHIGLIVWLITTAFAFGIYNNFLRESSSRIHLIISILIMSHLVYFYSHAHLWKIIHSSLAIISSGYSPGNFKTQLPIYDNWYWMCHLINTRTQRDERFLLYETPGIYGIERKTIFNFGHDRSPLIDLAENSEGSKILFQKIKGLGANNLLTGYYPQTKNHHKIQQKTIKTIDDLYKNHLMTHWVSPDGGIIWHVLTNSMANKSKRLTIEDAKLFPMIFLKAAALTYLRDHSEESFRLFQIASMAPMHKENRKHSQQMSFFSAAPNRIDGLLQFGQFFLDNGDNDISIEFYMAALEIDPAKYEAHLKLGKIFYGTRNYKQAIKAFELARRINPSKFPYYKILGNLFNNEGYHMQAIDCFNEGIKHRPSDKTFHINLGFSWLVQKDYLKAFPQLKKAIDLNPNNSNAHLYMGTYYLEIKDYQNSLKFLKKALKINPRDSRTKEMIKYLKTVL